MTFFLQQTYLSKRQIILETINKRLNGIWQFLDSVSEKVFSKIILTSINGREKYNTNEEENLTKMLSLTNTKRKARSPVSIKSLRDRESLRGWKHN